MTRSVVVAGSFGRRQGAGVATGVAGVPQNTTDGAKRVQSRQGRAGGPVCGGISRQAAAQVASAIDRNNGSNALDRFIGRLAPFRARVLLSLFPSTRH